MSPRYPVYIVSKGRWKSRLTARLLAEISVPFRIVVEPQEYEDYAAVISPDWVLPLPFSNLGQGSIPARNWIWEHSISEGHKRHWIMDDNISRFYRLHRNTETPIADGTMFAAIEDFADRYENLPIAGPNYEYLVKRKEIVPPFYANTRVYSCILLSNRLLYRWRGRYNEDTDLCLRVLKSGQCTALINALLAAKTPTMTMHGGNTDELYRRGDGFDGRLEMAKSLHRQHPDVVRVTRKWGRWQHHVDYRPFKKNALIRRPDVQIPAGVNDYGMRLVPVTREACRVEV